MKKQVLSLLSFLFPTALLFAQSEIKKDMKATGHEIKSATKKVGHETKRAAKKMGKSIRIETLKAKRVMKKTRSRSVAGDISDHGTQLTQKILLRRRNRVSQND